jgi:hypothetical protein
MSWPRSSDYRDALHHPPRCLHDPDLRRAQPVTDEQGRPYPIAGAGADVYEMRAGHDRWALKCYTRTPCGFGPRYTALFADLVDRQAPWLVGFQHLEQGICIRGRWYPVLKMIWCDGWPLDEFARRADDAMLERLAAAWLDLTVRLRQANMAHTDLHHRHVRVQTEPDGNLRLRLIDYDCLFTLALAEETPEKRLHPVYQHPQRLWLSAYNAEADRFGNLVIYTALRCLRLGGPQLRQRFDEGLLFRQGDFTEPGTAAVWQELWRLPSAEAQFLAGRLLLASQGPLNEVPLLHELVEGRDYRLSDDQRRAVEDVLRGGTEVEVGQAVLASGSGLSFNRKPDTEPDAATPSPDATKPLSKMSFDLFVDSDPELTVPPAPTTAVLPAIKPPPLPKTVPMAPPPLPASRPAPVVPPPSDFAQSRLKVYYTEAWMPQTVAVMKLQGFVRDLGGKVVASVPGLLRVCLLEKRPDKKKTDNAWSILGLLKQPERPPRELAIVDLHLRAVEHEHQSRLRVAIHFYPGNDPDMEEMEERDWQAFCDKIFCELRGFLIHAR